MAEWAQHAHILVDHAMPGVLGGVTALQFDTLSELLWAGSASGQVTSHSGALPTLPRYTSWAAHGTPAQPREVRSVLVDDRSVVSVGETSVVAAQRNGLRRWKLDVTYVYAV